MIVLSAPPFLRAVLLADGAACLAMGAGLVAGADALAGLFGLPRVLLVGAGAFLLPWGAFVLWRARGGALSRGALALILAVNLLWVVESLSLFAFEALAPTAWGKSFVLAQAGAVAAIAAVQFAALAQRRANALRPGQ